jgi:hypothetical protein
MTAPGDRSTPAIARRAHRVDHVLRVVSALSMSSVGAARGCGGGSVVACECPADASRSVIDGAPATGSCVAEELDAGCRTVQIGAGAGPLPPPELDA